MEMTDFAEYLGINDDPSTALSPRTVSPKVAPCHCVVNHNPNTGLNHWHHVFPLGWGGSGRGEKVALCPTAHTNSHLLLEAYKRNDGLPPWEIRRAFGPYIREVAQRGWDIYQAAQKQEQRQRRKGKE